MAAAMIAVVVEPDRPWPCSSTRNTVGITVEGQAHISTHLEHPGPEVGLILGLQRVGGVVGELTVELAVHHLQLRVEALERCGHDQATHAVGNVGDHREGR